MNNYLKTLALVCALTSFSFAGGTDQSYPSGHSAPTAAPAPFPSSYGVYNNAQTPNYNNYGHSAPTAAQANVSAPNGIYGNAQATNYNNYGYPSQPAAQATCVVGQTPINQPINKRQSLINFFQQGRDQQTLKSFDDAISYYKRFDIIQNNKQYNAENRFLIDLLYDHMSSLYSELGTSRQKSIYWENQYRNLSGKFKEKDKDLTTLKDSNQKLQDAYNDLKDKLTEQGKNLTAWQNSNKQWEDAYKALQENLQKKESDLNTINVTLNRERLSSAQENTTLSQTNEELQERADSLLKENNGLKQTIEELKSKIAELQGHKSKQPTIQPVPTKNLTGKTPIEQ